MNGSQPTALQMALEYYARGYSVVPVPPGSKNPGGIVGKGWQNLRLSKNDLDKYFSNGNNIGLLNGLPSRHIVDVDCDWIEAILLAPRFLPKTNMISGRVSSPLSHYWFKSKDAKTKKFTDPTLKDTDKRAMIVELRSSGTQTIVAPSIHPDGDAYIWHEFDDPEEVDFEALRLMVAKLAACALLARNWTNGKRHNLSLALAGTLLRAGWTVDSVKHFISSAAEVTGDNELQDRIVAVETTHEKTIAKQETTGIPTLKDLLDEAVVRKLLKWLEISYGSSSQPSGQKAANPKAPYGFQCLYSGVYSVDSSGASDEIFICSKLEITAFTRNRDNDDWGRLLEFNDPDGNKHSLPMPMSLFSGDGAEYRSRLLSSGLIIAPNRKARELLTIYIQTAQPDERLRCVDRVGWHDDAFVLPDETFGESTTERVLFQSATGSHHNLRINGTLEDWQQKIASYCVGNSRLIFSVSCAFAGPILRLTSEGGGGFNLRGTTSTGKTTAQFVSGSVWGGGGTKGYLQSWRTTINGLEAIAELHNNGLLCLDEIDQCDPREIGEIAYMLANGIGKARMTRSITARRKLEWDLIFLSSGERSLSDLIESVGKRVRGGQEVRMCDLEADAGVGMGLFENLHGFPSPGDFARYLTETSKIYYGSPIRAFLAQLVEHKSDLAKAVLNLRNEFIAKNVPQGASGEVIRAASRFALVAAAGEAAQEITLWPEGTAMDAASTMFKTWLDGRGTNDSIDVEGAIRQVRRFIEAHGASRFHSKDGDNEKIINRVGFKRIDEDGELEYLILAESFRKEVCVGYDYRMVANALKERGYLKTLKADRLTVQRRLPEFGKPNVYALRASIVDLTDDTDDTDDS